MILLYYITARKSRTFFFWNTRQDSNLHQTGLANQRLALQPRVHHLASPAGFEPTSSGVEVRCLFQLDQSEKNLVRVARIELARPSSADFKSAVVTDFTIPAKNLFNFF